MAEQDGVKWPHFVRTTKNVYKIVDTPPAMQKAATLGGTSKAETDWRPTPVETTKPSLGMTQLGTGLQTSASTFQIPLVQMKIKGTAIKNN